MSYRYVFSALGVLLIAVGLARQGWLWLAVWLGVDFLLLGAAHSRGWHRLFGKHNGGTLPWWSWLLYFPLLIQSNVTWQLIRLASREPAFNQVSDNLTIGRRLLAGELPGEYDNFVDLTAEFTELTPIRQAASYRCFPILDGAAPSVEDLQAMVASLRPGRTFVHCAQGHGRTALFALALLLDSGAVEDVESGIRMLAAARPAIRLSRDQRRCIQAYAQQSRAATGKG